MLFRSHYKFNINLFCLFACLFVSFCLVIIFRLKLVADVNVCFCVLHVPRIKSGCYDAKAGRYERSSGRCGRDCPGYCYDLDVRCSLRDHSEANALLRPWSEAISVICIVHACVVFSMERYLAWNRLRAFAFSKIWTIISFTSSRLASASVPDPRTTL